MVVAAEHPRLALAWQDSRQRPIRAYTYWGGGHVVVALELSPTDGIVLVNRRLVPPSVTHLAVWWAILAIESGGDDGYHAIYTGDLGARP